MRWNARSDIVGSEVRLDSVRSRELLPSLRYDQRHIIRLFATAELLHFAENAIQDFGRRLALQLANSRNQTLFAELFAVAVFAFSRLGNTVGINHQNVAGSEFTIHDLAVPFFKHPQHRRGRLEPLDIAI